MAYAEKLAYLYAERCDYEIRKLRGQFFTPLQVSWHMAGLFNLEGKDNVRLLDPGAGTGILSAAVCERVLSLNHPVHLTIDAYENDPALLPLLEQVLTICQKYMSEHGHRIDYHIYEQDFILHNQRFFQGNGLLQTTQKKVFYDYIISNPPYYKINKDSPHAAAMRALISGQPNIYALFMAMAAAMLKNQGEMVFITPRSFCSGLYYKRFRKWFLNKVTIELIHIFESRRRVFYKDKVLQENVILKARAAKENRIPEKVKISACQDITYADLRSLEVEAKDVFFYKNGDLFVRIPTSIMEIAIQRLVDTWPQTLHKLGLEISTGPVVAFRCKEHLLADLRDSRKEAPLLWMHNIRHRTVEWPYRKNGKPTAIRICPETRAMLLPVKNYVLVKRFSSKEQKRRLYSSVLLKSEFPFEVIGLENHLNYIHRPKGDLTEYEAIGIAALLNTALIDKFFRTLNGNTQVNAEDLRCLPLPAMGDIISIGKRVAKLRGVENGIAIDRIVAEVLRIDMGIIRALYRKE
ncbi:MAG: Eco57I restriction-modification methylase domain-containing protein [Candidatus Hadarchaeum sp.]